MEPESYSFSRYLSAKRSVDERARNRRVYDQFVARLVERGKTQSRALKILEVAGGIGHTAMRVLDSLSNSTISAIDYTFVDINPNLVDAAHKQLLKWGCEKGFDRQVSADRIVFEEEGGAGTLSVEFVAGDAFDVLAETSPSSYDAVITQAWLDLVNLETALERIFRVLSGGGLFYAPIHFDGETRFLPVENEILEESILERYHRSMDGRETPHGLAGGRRTGSRLLIEVPRAGGRIEAAGASDWIVRPRADGHYPNDEEYFLHHVLHFIEEEISEHPRLDRSAFNNWIEERHRRVGHGELIYIAHQFDMLGRKKET